MRHLMLCGAAAIVLAAATGAGPAAADERWCAIYNGADGNGGVNCGFYTLQQCRDTISGAGGTCEFDYMYEQEKQRRALERSPRKRPRR
jgi:hypothetical protein